MMSMIVGDTRITFVSNLKKGKHYGKYYTFVDRAACMKFYNNMVNTLFLGFFEKCQFLYKDLEG